MENSTADWLADLDETMYARIAATRLVQARVKAVHTVGELMERYFAGMAAKPATRVFYGHTRRNLESHFGTGRDIASIGPAEADGFKAWIAGHEKLSPATVARRTVAARTIWRKAVRWGWVSVNPFDGIRGSTQTDDRRKRFISRETIQKVLDNCPDDQWRLIVALSRFGGVRCPSETLALTWADVDFANGMIRVRSCKTEHHEGGGARTIPLFAELEPLLLAEFAGLPEGTNLEATPIISRYRDPSVNLRTQLKRIIKRAGLTVWPKLFHNLRASRETELMREYDLATVCKWIGNSPAVAAKHYALCVDLDAGFQRAAGRGKSAAQNQAQYASIPAEKGREAAKAVNKDRPDLPSDADPSRCLLNRQVGDIGLEPTTSRV
jgi:integrase